MDPGRPPLGPPARKPPGPASTKGPGPRVTISPFHNSPILGNAALRSKRPAASPGKPAASPGKPAASPGRMFLAARLSAGSSGTPAPSTPEAGKAASLFVPPPKSASKMTQTGEAEPQDGRVEAGAGSGRPHTAVRKRRRKMGTYNLVPKKKTKTLKHNKRQKADRAEKHPEPLPISKEGAGPGGGGHVGYTELTLDCLDLKAQEELLSPPLLAGAAGESQVMDDDLAGELPLCCCRMETPHSGGGGAAAHHTCMATESAEGTLLMPRRCGRAVVKQDMMRPSNAVPLLVLCEDHRAAMVQHHCCPGCGLFCRTGSFMECRPHGGISHRFHRRCASILKDCRFCPHCGEDASGAVELLVSKHDRSPSLPRSNPGPVTASLPPLPTTPQVLRAKKSSEPRRSPEDSPTRLTDAADRICKESLENILTALDDDNFKPKKVKFPARQLYLSAKQGDLQRVIQLLVDGKDPNLLMDDPGRRTPLHAAASEGHQEVCHMLVQAGANLDMFDEEHRTPLMAACENKHLETVKYLLRAGAAAGNKDIMGFTCLHLAAKLGHYDIIHHLLAKASKYINCQDDGGWTPITWAIEYKHRDLVHLLLSRGADVNIRDKEGNVCLHWAALSGCDDISTALLEARCELNAVNVHGDTPLHVAARENHLDCVMVFLSRGADVSQRNKEGGTALDCCPRGSKVWTALSTNQKLMEARRGRDFQGERLLSRDISRGYEAVAISCVNGVDGEPCPDNFRYVPESCVTSALHIDKDITHLQHCSCSDDCSSSSCVCGQLSLRCWYDSEGRLPLDFSQWEPPVLFECNHACSCWRTCRNRVVQNGLRVRLQLYRTEKMGWGVRALQDVPQGTFICEYVGEIITDAEADKRENDSFLFTLDNKVGDIHCMDARLFGNIGRFINHLCEPNLLALRVFTMHQDLRFPRVAFFSSRPIKAGDQIGMDYGESYWRVKKKYFSCQCGSLRCRHSTASP